MLLTHVREELKDKWIDRELMALKFSNDKYVWIRGNTTAGLSADDSQSQ